MTELALPRKSLWIRIGDFLFKSRNGVFPVLLIGLFVAFPAPAQYGGNPAWEEWKDAVAVAITLSGVGFRAAVIGFAYIKRGGLNKKVYAENLVTEGFFGICRNPLYVGNMLIYTGVFLMHGHPAVVVLGILSYWLIYESIIAAEEFFLRGKFGPGYEDYCRDVPRWLPRFSRLKESVEGMTFNFKRVLVKDYTTIANAGMALLLLQLLEEFHAGPKQVFLRDLPLLLTPVVLLAIATGLISLAKRRKWLRAS
jgi:protein-S-isoprenylcysteine O-methyltransferase Ste14